MTRKLDGNARGIEELKEGIRGEKLGRGKR
jgi:hypothetical protein